jgi:hypothetical protein
VEGVAEATEGREEVPIEGEAAVATDDGIEAAEGHGEAPAGEGGAIIVRDDVEAAEGNGDAPVGEGGAVAVDVEGDRGAWSEPPWSERPWLGAGTQRVPICSPFVTAGRTRFLRVDGEPQQRRAENLGSRSLPP